MFCFADLQKHCLPSSGLVLRFDANHCAQEADEDLDGDDESGWETASDEEEEAHFDAAAVAGSAGGEAQRRAVQEVSPAPDASQVPLDLFTLP